VNAASPLDVVLGDRSDAPERRRWLRAAAWASAIVVHAAVVVAAMNSGPSLEAWSAGLALEVHEALVDDQVIELATPPTPPPEAPPVAAPRALPASPAHRNTPTTDAPPPAAAAAIVTQDEAPVDLTGTTIVTGTTTAPIGGPSATTGVSTTPADTARVDGQLAAPTSPAPAPLLTRAVQLDPAEWRCDWPREAIEQEIYDQAVVLRVVVRADGRVEAAQLIEDPGHGFGPAALACAKRTLFSPALDADGTPTRAVSPPIRVRFTR